jgi:Skp family chaperone for outer membrane proteins
LDRRFILQWHTTIIEKRELLKTIKDKLAEMKSMQEDMKANQAKADADRDERKQEMKACLEHLAEEIKAQISSFVSRIEDTNEKFQVLHGALVSRMDAHQERIIVCLERLRPRI